MLRVPWGLLEQTDPQDPQDRWELQVNPGEMAEMLRGSIQTAVSRATMETEAIRFSVRERHLAVLFWLMESPPPMGRERRRAHVREQKMSA